MLLALILSIISFVSVVNLTGHIRTALLARRVLDTPNERSLHSEAVPRGGGLAIWLVVLPLWGLALYIHNALAPHIWVMAGAVLLMAVSWWDDKKSLSPLIRLLAQLAAVALGLLSLPQDMLVFQGFLPLIADRLLAGIMWVWFINLTNFMDGIDGISAAQASHTALGFLVVSLLGGGNLIAENALAACLLGGALGFMTWNWSPAKIFLGDVGSVPLGFLLGYLMMVLAINGYLAIAFVLPLYYLADATITLFRRMAERKKVWQPHREHFYQKAALAAGSHAKVVKTVIGGNLGLLVLCVLALKTSVWALLAAPLLVGGILWYLKRLAGPSSRA